jgi:hypothetical protein
MSKVLSLKLREEIFDAEHTREYQTIWNGNGGRMYLYQSEFPYDPPDQGSWQHEGKNGYASYKVADTVKTHEASKNP